MGLVRSALLVIPVLAACGARLGSSEVDQRPDAAAGQRVDGAVSLPDAAQMNVDNDCGIAANQGDLGLMIGTAGAQAQGTSTAQTYFVAAPTSLSAMQPIPDVISVELWDGYGAFANGMARTGTFTISGDETDYDTCGICVLMAANLVNNTPAKLLLATTGTVTVTSIATEAGQTTEVEVSNASFVEITNVPNQGYEPVTTSSCPSPIMHGTVRGTR